MTKWPVPEFRLFADYGADSPLWYAGMVPLDELHLHPDTTRRLRTVAHVYDAKLDAVTGGPSNEDRLAYNAEIAG
jgi:hypothetical protein